MRVAASRVAVIDSISATRTHAGRCVSALPVSLPALKKIGVALGSAAAAVGVCAGIRKKKKAAEIKTANSSSSSFILQLLLQVLGPVLLPMAQKALQKKLGTPDVAPGKSFNL